MGRYRGDYYNVGEDRELYTHPPTAEVESGQIQKEGQVGALQERCTAATHYHLYTAISPNCLAT